MIRESIYYRRGTHQQVYIPANETAMNIELPAWGDASCDRIADAGNFGPFLIHNSYNRSTDLSHEPQPIIMTWHGKQKPCHDWDTIPVYMFGFKLYVGCGLK